METPEDAHSEVPPPAQPVGGPYQEPSASQLARLPGADIPAWREARQAIEGSKNRSGFKGKRRKHWRWFQIVVSFMYRLLGKTPLMAYMRHYALQTKLKNIEIYFPDWPHEFQFYKILHLTDLHLDLAAGFTDAIVKAIQGVDCDLLLLTGDYQDSFQIDPRINSSCLQRIIASVNSRDGVVAVLGNHDHHTAREMLEGLGANVLVNESLVLARGGAKFMLTGLDDVHYYYQEAARQALETQRPTNIFKIAAVHSPEMAEVAAASGYGFYVCGHTHGGQVCLPFGIPLITHAEVKRRMVKGVWYQGAMVGYTSRGCGASYRPIRWHCPSEVTLITMRRGQKLVVT